MNITWRIQAVGKYKNLTPRKHRNIGVIVFREDDDCFYLKKLRTSVLIVMIYAFVVICLLGEALARVPSRDCRNIIPMKKFDVTKFVGKWYSLETSNPIEDIDCGSINLVAENGDYCLHLQHRNRSLGGISHNPDLTPDASEYVIENDKFEVTDDFFDELVIATDYTSYAVLHWWDDDTVVIVTRDQHPIETVRNTALKIVQEKFGNIKLTARNGPGCGPSTQS